MSNLLERYIKIFIRIRRLFKNFSFLDLSLIGTAINILIALILTQIYKLVNFEFLSMGGSDFLTAFPNFRFSHLFGTVHSLFYGSVAEGWMGEKYWNYGPLHQFLTIPLYFFGSMADVTAFLFFILLLTYLASIKTLSQLTLSERFQRRHLLCLILVLVINYPFLSALGQRNLEILEIAFVSAAMIAFKQKKFLLSGVLIGFATGIKFLPGIILLHFILSRNWGAVKGFFMAIVPQAILTQLFLGWQNSYLMLDLLDGEVGTAAHCQGLNDFLKRLFQGKPTKIETVLYLGISITALILISIFLLQLNRNSFRNQQQWKVWPLLIAISVLLSPHANNYYFVLVVPLIIQIYAQLISQPIGINHFLFGISLLSLSLVLPLAILWRILPSDISMILQNKLTEVQSYSPMFIGTLILIFLFFKLKVIGRIDSCN